MATRQVLRTVAFPPGSRPYMLRVSRDGREVWVQTAEGNTNVVLDAEDLSVLATESIGRGPVTNAWTPDNRYSFVTHTGDTFVSIFDAGTFREVARLSVGQGSSNVGFTRDGTTAFVAVTREDTVAVIDVDRLVVTGHIAVGGQPQGLIIL
jgi:YVTN family beta-propeller protein